MAARYRACIRSRSFGLQAVPDTVHGMDELRIAFHSNFLTQAIDVHLDEVRPRIKVDVPDVLDDLRASHHFRRAAEKEFQQREFFGSQRNCAACAAHASLMPIQFQIAMAEDAAARGAPPDERANSSEQFGYREWLRHVIIRARIQTLHSLLDEAARGEHQNRSIHAGITQFAANLQSTQPRESDIEQNAVIRGVSGHHDGFLARLRQIDSVGILAQGPADETSHATLVLDQEYTHTGHNSSSDA